MSRPIFIVEFKFKLTLIVYAIGICYPSYIRGFLEFIDFYLWGLENRV